MLYQKTGKDIEEGMTSAPMFRCVAIVGVGMMGGSLGGALRSTGLAEEVVGVDRDGEALTQGVALGVLDRGTLSLKEAVQEADLVVLATPVASIPLLLTDLAPLVGTDALITDIGSTKQRIVESGERLFGGRFVGGHPMAGAPRGGVEASLPDLFAGAAWALVGSQQPEPETEHVARLTALVHALGARTIYLDSERHDRIVALVSHLPHLLSFAFADTVAGSPDPDMAHEMAGGSFRDLMRVSEADRPFWDAIFQENRTALLDALTAYERNLASLRQGIFQD